MVRRLLLPLLVLSACLSMSAGEFAGCWKGEVAGLQVIFNIEEDAGAFSAALDSPMQGAKDVPCGNVTVKGDSITIDMPLLSARFAGRMQSDGQSVTGTFTQGVSMPVTFVRTTREAAALYRPQEPKPPFVYHSEDVKFSHDGITFAGTLTTPMWGTRHPAVVLVTGSGTQNRDEEIYGHKPFAVIADYLTRSGIAVLRYDDRGAGESMSGPDDANATTADIAEDAIAAIDFLKSYPGIDASRIGVLGHSEGGTIAFMCASRRPEDVAFVISMAGGAVKGKELMIRQNVMIAEASGQKLTPEQEAAVERMFSAIDAIDDKTVLADTLRSEMTRMAVGGEEQMERSIKLMTMPWYVAFVRLDPSEYIRQTKCPVLALNGEWDVQVDAVQNLRAVESLNPEATVKSYPRLNHLFQECQSLGQSLGYGAIPQTISPAVLEDVARWIVSVAAK